MTNDDVKIKIEETNDNVNVVSSPDQSFVIAETTEINIDPKSWPPRKKFFILFIVSFAGMIAPISSTYVI